MFKKEYCEFGGIEEMKQQQQHNPNPNPNPKSCTTKLRRRDPSKSWSNLPGDLLNSVFERLGLADSRRVESVCRSWCSAARQCSAKKQIPWLIILPDEEDKIERHWCTLFNPEEKGKLYRMRADVYEFANSACLATHGNWLLMVDHWSDLYLLNLFTHEKIYLPEVESQLGTTKLERTSSRGRFCLSNDQLHRPMKLKGINEIMHSPVFWIDEETKEYVVVWALGEWCVVYSKKGDALWNQIQMPPLPAFTERFFDMVYKDDKLYLLLHTGRRGRSTGFIKIFDFSTQIPQETFHCGVTSNNNNTSDSDSDSWRVWATKLVVTVTGHVLKVEKLEKLVNPGQGGPLRLWSFRVYKHHDEPVASLGHEAMLFDLGFTVLADDHLVGFKSNSIYFNVICQKLNTTQICVFNLDTQEMEEPLPKFVCSSWQQRLRARWFLPSFKHT